MASPVDSRKLELAVKRMVQRAIPDKLSTYREKVDGVISNYPSVILARETTMDGTVVSAPPYPFVMIDKAQQQDLTTVIDRYVDERPDGTYDHVHTTPVVARVNIKVFGIPSDSVDDIASHLCQAFSVQDYQALIETEYGDECAFTQTSNPVEANAFINNVSQDTCSFDAYFSLIREYRQVDIDTIEDVKTDTNLFHVGGEPLL